MLGNRIRERREHKRLLQKEVANYVGVSQQAVARWEKGETEPDSETLIKLAELFECSVDYLLGRTNISTPIETLAAHRTDDLLKELPENARQSLIEFQNYILTKYSKKKD